MPWLTDRKWAYIRMEGSSFGDVPLNVELKLEVWDSPNSAGIVIDAVRMAKLALNNGISGALEGPSSYLMKSPPKQIVDDEAYEACEKFIKQNARKARRPAARRNAAEAQHSPPLLAGAAILFAIAALVAIVAVLGGRLGGDAVARRSARAGSRSSAGATLAGLACLDARRSSGRSPIAAVVLGARVLRGRGPARLRTSADARVLEARRRRRRVDARGAQRARRSSCVTSARVAARLVVGTIGARVLAAVRGELDDPSREFGDAWQLVAVRVILTLLGYIATPILQRFSAAAEAPPPAERLLGSVADVERSQCAGDAQPVQIGRARRAARQRREDRPPVRERVRFRAIALPAPSSLAVATALAVAAAAAGGRMAVQAAQVRADLRRKGAHDYTYGIKVFQAPLALLDGAARR